MHRCLIFFATLIFSLPLFADQLIIEPDMGRKPLLNAIDETRHSLDLVMYGFTDAELRDAIIQKKNQGKTVKVILEDRPHKSRQENQKTITAFDQNNITWKTNIPPFRLIHQKTLILDDNKALIMTLNFTQSAFTQQRNFILVIDDPKRVKAITRLFAADWNHVPYDSYDPDLIISPDNSRDKILSLVSQAKQSIKIYAQTIDDYKIIGALANAARQSVKVEIITSSQPGGGKERYLERAGVVIHHNNELMIHAKVIMIDNVKALIGSINLTQSSLDNNRELSVITRDRKVLEQLNKVFMNDSQS